MCKEAIINDWARRHPVFMKDFTGIMLTYKRWQIKPTCNIVKVMFATHGFQLEKFSAEEFFSVFS